MSTTNYVAVIMRTTDTGYHGVSHIVGPFLSHAEAAAQGRRVIEAMEFFAPIDSSDSLTLSTCVLAPNFEAMLPKGDE
jgi:hypothetical protein